MIRSGNRHHTEKITNLKDGSIKYSIYASGLTEIARWLIGFGSLAQVVKPKELTDLVHSMAVGACNCYPDQDDLSICRKLMDLKTEFEDRPS